MKSIMICAFALIVALIVALATAGKVHKSGGHADFVVALNEAKGLLDI